MTMTQKLLVTAACACTLFANSLSLSAAETAAAPTTPVELHAALQTLMKDKHIPGASYAVFDRNGQLSSDTLGVTDTAHPTPVSDHTLFRIGSITKTVTAIAILQLIEQGHFDLQTPVKNLLPEAPIVNPYVATDPVRVIHLLSHTAGFDDTHPKGFFSATERRGKHLAALKANPEPLVARWRPGLYHSYSNPDYVLLGAILEAHYHQPWDDIVREHVLLPLGMNDTLALNSEAAKLDHANGHTGDGMTPTGLPFDTSQADGALWCTATDLARLGRFLLSDGASAPGVLSPATIAQMKQLQGTLGARAGLKTGYGFALTDRIIDGMDWKGHTGGVPGQLASLQFLQEQGIGYVLLVNSDNALRPLEKPIAGFIRGKTGWQAPALVTEKAPTDVDGWYRIINARSDLLGLPYRLLTAGHFRAEGDVLTYSPVIPKLGTGYRFKYLGRDRLGEVDDNYVESSQIIRNANGEVEGVEVNGDYLKRVSMFDAILPPLSVVLSLLFLLTAPFGRRKVLNNRWLRRLPTLALLTLIAAVVCLANIELLGVVEKTWQTVGLYVATTLFPILGVLGLLLSVLTWRNETAALAKWRCLLGSLSVVVLGAWFANYELFALALWSW